MKHPALAALAALALAAGCRREDIKDFTVEIPSLTRENAKTVADAFTLRKPGVPDRVYDGIKPETFRFDFEKKTLSMRYDSMKIAKTNIRMLIRDKGVEVLFPSNTTGTAGYIDRKVE